MIWGLVQQALLHGLLCRLMDVEAERSAVSNISPSYRQSSFNFVLQHSNLSSNVMYGIADSSQS